MRAPSGSVELWQEEREGEVHVVDEEADHLAQRRCHGGDGAQEAKGREMIVAAGVEAERRIAGAPEEEAHQRVHALDGYGGARVVE
jgi:hypothetical protein